MSLWGLLGWRLPLPGGTSILLPAAATPAQPPGPTDPMVLCWFSHSLGSPLPAWSAGLGWEVPSLCMFFVTVSIFPAINSHHGWARSLSFHSILPVAWARARMSHSSGLSQRGKSLSWSSSWTGALGVWAMSLSPAQWLRVKPQRSLTVLIGSCLKNTMKVTDQELWG